MADPGQNAVDVENPDEDTAVFDVSPEIFQDANDDWIDIRQQQFRLRGQSGSVSSISSGSAHGTKTSSMSNLADVIEVPPSTNPYRAIIHVDLDCFFVQVEESLNPLLKGRPVAVHQHEDIISVSYEARALGVKKHMTPAEAVAVSNDAVVLVPMQTDHGSKVSYRVYREASARVMEAAKSCFLTTAVFEKASIDEFYVDVSALVQSAAHEHASEFTSPPQTATNMGSQRLEHSQGQSDPNTRAWPPCVIIGEVCGVLLPEEDCLRTASFLALKIRDAIQLEVGFSSSAGVAPNKLLAKIASGMNKPRNQTVILHRNVPDLMHKMPLRKLPRVITRAGHHALADLERVFNVSTCGELIRDGVNHSMTELVARYGEASGSWLYTRARGDDDDAVKEKPPQKTIACSMSLTPFGPKQDHLLKVLNMIAAELADRLRKDFEENDRKPQRFYLLYRNVGCKEKHCHTPVSAIARLAPPGQCDFDEGRASVSAIVTTSMTMFLKSIKASMESWNLRWIALCFGQFCNAPRSKVAITNFFRRSTDATNTSAIVIDDDGPRPFVRDAKHDDDDDDDCILVEPPSKRQRVD